MNPAFVCRHRQGKLSANTTLIIRSGGGGGGQGIGTGG